MNLHIESVNTKIVNNFPDLWWNDYHFAEDTSEDNWHADKEKFNRLIEKLKEELFDELNSSVLIGEYVLIDDFDQKIKETIKAIDKIPQPLPNEEIQDFLLEEFKTNFTEVFSYSLSLYLSFCIQFKYKFDLDNREFVLTYNPEINNFLENNKFSLHSEQNIEFFNANLKLAILDNNLTPDVEDFNFLLGLSDSIVKQKKLGINKFALLVREKSKFLLCKWILRKQHLNKNQVFYLRDNNEVKANIDEFKNSIIPHWKNYIESHYEISKNWESEISNDFDRIKKIKFEKLKLSELHRLIKYYKDVNKNLPNLNGVLTEIEKRFKKYKSSGKRDLFYSYSVSYIYALNNEFSLYLEQPDIKEEDCYSMYEKIQSVQAEIGLKNFFPQYKYLGFLVKKLENLYKERKALDFLAPSRLLINRCENIFKSYSENVEWCELHYNYTFQLPYEECLVNTNDSSFTQCYISSSFLLPLSKEKYKKEFDENQDKVYKFKASIEVFENLEQNILELTSIKEQIVQTKNEQQQREVKTMEILGIFTAVVTFVLGSLPTFKYINTPYQAALFMFAFASSLSIFVLLIFSINRGIEVIKSRKNLLISIGSFVILSWTGLILFTNDPIENEENKDEIKYEIIIKNDSVKNKINNLYIDSFKMKKTQN